MTRVRRHLHANPELSGQEFATRDFLRGEFARAGFKDIRDIAGTGLRVVYDTGRPGPAVALRAELDALPIEERTGLPFASTNRGVMHACGHDLHAAALLGAAELIRADPGLRGRYVFLFEPGEEGSTNRAFTGAERLIAEGALDDPTPDAVFAAHVADHLVVGEVGCRAGPMMAAASVLRIELRGEAAHPSVRGDGGDTISLVRDVLDLRDDFNERWLADGGWVSITAIHGGHRFNVMPESTRLEGSLRARTDETLGHLVVAFSEAVAEACRRRRGDADLRHRLLTPAVVNDDELTARSTTALRDAGFRVVEAGPLLAADDFALLAREAPAVYLLVGASETNRAAGPLHTADFNPSEQAMPVIARLFHELARMVSGAAP
jgi:amidohydrolase